MSISYGDGFLTHCQMTPVRPLHWVLELSWLLNMGGLNESEVQISLFRLVQTFQIRNVLDALA